MVNMLVYFVIYIVVIGLIIGLLLWLIDNVPIPEPFHRIARIAIIVIGVLIVIVLLLSLLDGGGTPRFKIGETNGLLESAAAKASQAAYRHQAAAG